MNGTYLVGGVLMLVILIGGLRMIDVLAPAGVMLRRSLVFRPVFVFWTLGNALGGIALGLRLPDPWYLVSLVAALACPVLAAIAEFFRVRHQRSALAALFLAGEPLPPRTDAALVERWVVRRRMTSES